MVIRRAARKRREEYGENHIEVLLTGNSFFLGDTAFFHPGTDDMNIEAVADAWETLRETLLPAFIAENPGERPWAWWRFEAPEKRRRVIEGYDCWSDPERPERVRHESFGAHTTVGWEEFRDPTVFESQAAYLDRHGLLTDQERQALGDDYEREETVGVRLPFAVNHKGLPEYRTTWPTHKERE